MLTSRKTRRIKILGALALTVAMLSTGAMADHVPLVDISLGFPFQTNLDANDGGFTKFTPPYVPIPPANSSWAHGTPTSGPGFAFSGTKVWATNLAGNYNNSECGGLLSPPIDLTGATSASVSFQQWRHMEQSTTTAWDGGALFVTTNGGQSLSLVTPAGGYTSSVLSATARTCLHALPTGSKGLSGPTGSIPPAAVYTPVTTDISAFAGQTVQFVIAFASDGIINSRHGWYIDDFAVTTNLGSTLQDFESGNGGFSIIHTGVPKLPLGWSHGENTTGPEIVAGNKMWATNLGGNYGYNECSYIESPEIDLKPLPVDLAELDDDLPFITATASWKQWFRSSSVSAGGVVQVVEGASVKNLIPTTGYTGNPTATGLDACLGHITSGSRAFSGATDIAGTPMTDYAADLTPYVGKKVKLRFLFASTNTAVLDLGWYVDNIAVELNLLVGEPHPPEPPAGVPFTPAQNLYTQNFEAGDGSFTTGGTTTFQYGTPTVGPTTTSKLWGTNLSGQYSNNECGYLQSPAIDLSSVPGGAPPEAGRLAQLSLQHWREIELRWDGVIVMLSANGTDWEVATPDGGYDNTPLTAAQACLGIPSTQKFFTGPSTQANNTDFETETFDVSKFLGGALHIRFAWATDSSVTRRGWYVDNLAIDLGAGVNLPELPEPPPPPASL